MTALLFPFDEAGGGTLSSGMSTLPLSSPSSSDSTTAALLIRLALLRVDGPAGGTLRPRVETLPDAERTGVALAPPAGRTGVGPTSRPNTQGSVNRRLISGAEAPVVPVISAKVVGGPFGSRDPVASAGTVASGNPVRAGTIASGVVVVPGARDETVNKEGTRILSPCLCAERGTYQA